MAIEGRYKSVVQISCFAVVSLLQVACTDLQPKGKIDTPSDLFYTCISAVYAESILHHRDTRKAYAVSRNSCKKYERGYVADLKKQYPRSYSSKFIANDKRFYRMLSKA